MKHFIHALIAVQVCTTIWLSSEVFMDKANEVTYIAIAFNIFFVLVNFNTLNRLKK